MYALKQLFGENVEIVTEESSMENAEYKEWQANKYDKVKCPAHYCEGRMYEPIDVIDDWQLGFCLGNALKYISRAGRKGNKTDDLKKAIWYIEREIKILSEPAEKPAQKKSYKTLEEVMASTMYEG